MAGIGASFGGASWLRLRVAALLALCVPTLSGLVFLAWFEAPHSYFIVNGAALATGLAAIAFFSMPDALYPRRALVCAGLALLAAPMVLGPEINGVQRWISLGGISLHTGSLTIPLIVCLAARDRPLAAPILLAAVFLCLLQPDAACAFALMLASVGLYFAWLDWRLGVTAMAGFAAALLASVRGNLAPQAFVEGIFGDLIFVAPWFALWLGLSLVIAFFLILKALPRPAAERFALAGALAGFSLTALMASYPLVLIGYGAAPILGFALALGARTRTSPKDHFFEGQ
ncbi:hypothetical protein INR77_11655 [Erythrobacter sp. SCSIO 43205]|uniref:hypothetical protein n=1 Tax=Erythrobacter sp. SCSIO 43205 TaxID=2779361 RepID=UPI001CA95B6F|nr:hypothetical protein [Erythrobacter sp. SCSIO 43205]UAB77450.1 hypothetical protein INR77_11655 [Erythrobacter sp. SCSIO 43205]